MAHTATTQESTDADGRVVLRRPPPRPDWLALAVEEVVLEPDLPIIDAHHHIWDSDGGYLVTDLLADAGSGHRIVATVFMHSHWGYREHGPEAMRSVGEVERVAAIAEQAERDGLPTRICAGIVGEADLRLGSAIAPVLEAQVAAGRGRFRGIRHATVRDELITNNPSRLLPPDLLLQPAFRRGLKQLQIAGLTYDAWLYHPQIGQLTTVARALPQLRIVLDHIGAPLGAGPYALRGHEVFDEWRAAMKELASCPNVNVKLGGLGMIVFGFDFHKQPIPPDSLQLADAWRPYVEAVIELFGPSRCMFQSNFPVDKGACSYTALWNAFKRITSGHSDADRAQLFAGTAARVYGLNRFNAPGSSTGSPELSTA